MLPDCGRKDRDKTVRNRQKNIRTNTKPLVYIQQNGAFLGDESSHHKISAPLRWAFITQAPLHILNTGQFTLNSQ
jgi:hypothetical protein